MALMSLGIPPTGSTPAPLDGLAVPPVPPGAVPAPAPPVLDAAATAPGEDRVETSPAYRRAIDLALDSRELRFSRDQETGRIVVEVRTLDGETVRIIPDDDELAALAGRDLR